MPINYSNTNSVTITPGGSIALIPSNSAFSPTSSAPNKQAELEINISSSFPANIISDTKQNPFIRFTVISGSNLGGTNSDIVIRFFSQSHIQTRFTNRDITNNVGNVKPENANLYLKRTSADNIEFLDVKYTKGQTGSSLGVATFHAITSSTAYKQGLISASFISSALSHSTTIQYVNARGAIKTAPTLSTGSGDLPLGNSIVVAYTTTGSGDGFNFSETAVISSESSSLIIGPADEVTNTDSIVFRQGISSSGFINNNKSESIFLFLSSSGAVGIQTKFPRSELEVSGSIKGKEIVTKPSGSDPKPIKIKDSEIKFYSTDQEDPNHEDYDVDKERARIKALPGSFNLIFEVSGSNGYTKSVFISQSGRIGFNTDKPTSGFDVLSDESTFQKPGARKGLKINQFGDIESFNRELASAATGSEILLKYSRGVEINQEFIASVFGASVASDGAAETFFNNLATEEQNEGLQKAEELGLIVPPAVGDVLGSIRFIAESGSINDLDERTTGEAASIQAKVHTVGEGGVRGDLIFNVADQTGASVQRMVLDAGDNHQLSGSLIVGGTDSQSATIKMMGTGGNNQAGFFRVGSSAADLKIGRMLLFDDGTQKVQISAKGKSFIAGTSGTGTTGTFFGINNNNPLHTLAVTGDITASGFLKIDGAVTASGHISGSIIEGQTLTADVFLSAPSASITNLTNTNITSSGNISASGNLTANGITIETGGPVLTLKDTTDDDDHRILFRDESNNIVHEIRTNDDTGGLGGDMLLIKAKENKPLGLGTNNILRLTVEAGGNISASGGITAHSFTGSFSGAVIGDATGLTGTPSISVTNITASGNISASGDLTGDEVNINQFINHIGDADTYFGFSANNQVLFHVGGGDRLLINSAGNVGIGNTNPQNILHITKDQGGASSALKLENKAGADNTGFDIDFQLASSGLSAKIGAVRTNTPGAGDTDLFFSTSTNGTTATEAMRISHDGNISASGNFIINQITASGDIILGDHLNLGGGETILDNHSGGYLGFFAAGGSAKNIKAKSIVLSNDFNDSAPTNGLFVKGGANFNSHITASGNISGSTIEGQTLIADVFLSAPSASITNLTNTNITSSGNISASGTGIFNKASIGIDTPVPIFHVFENSSNTTHITGQTIENAGTGDAILNFLLTGVRRWVVGIDNSDSDKFKIASSIDLASDAHFTVDTNGKVGLGTTSPGNNLHIFEDNSSANALLKLEQSGSGDAVIDFVLTNQNLYRVGIDNDNNDAFTIARGTFGGSLDDLIIKGGNVEVVRDLTVGGTITAQEFHTQFVSASILFNSGSTKFGDTLDDNHEMTGSFKLTGSQELAGNLTISSIGQLRLGGTDDFKIFQDGADSQIINRSSGDLIISSQVTNSDLMLKNVAGGGTTNYIVLDGGEEKSIFYRPTRHRDNVTASFGTGDDLKIYHDSSNSYIEDAGTGDLILRTNGTAIRMVNAGETMLKGIANGAVELYHNNNKKLETTAGGIDITGNITASGNISSSGDIISNDIFIDDNIFHNGNTTTRLNFEGDNLYRVIIAGSEKILYSTSNTRFSNNDILLNSVDISGSGDSNVVVTNVTSSGGLGFTHFSNFITFGIGGTANTFKYNEWKQSASGGTTINNTAGTINFDSKGNADTMVISGSSVGIGTSSPSAKLHLSGSNGDTAESALRQSRAGVRIWDQAIDSSGRLQWGYRSSEGGSRTVVFSLANSSNNNVGIGTGAPGEALEVVGNISSSGTGSFSDGRISGKLGIGTNTPHLPLHVEGNTRIEGNFIVGNCAPTNNPAADIHIKSSGTDAKLRIEDLDDDNLAYDFLVNSGSGLTITETTDATSRIHIEQGTGNIGIGTASPGEKLTVAGNISASGRISLSEGSSNTAGQGLRFRNRADLGLFEHNFDLGIMAPDSVQIHIDSNDNDDDSRHFSIVKNHSTIASQTGLIFKVREDATVSIYSHLSASGNISASGTITAASFVGAVSGDATGLTGTPDITVGNITASGNISASGQVKAQSFVLDYQQSVTGINSIGNDVVFLRIDDGQFGVVNGVSNIVRGLQTGNTNGWQIGNTNAGISGRQATGVSTVAINAGGNQVLTITGSEAGLGTTTPSAKLHISQSTSDPGLLVDGGIGGNFIAKFRRTEGLSPSAEAFVGINLSDSDAQIRFEPSTETNRWSIGASNTSPGNFEIAPSTKISGNEVIHFNRAGGIYATSITASSNISASGIVQGTSFKIGAATVLSGQTNVILGSAGATGTISLNTHGGTPFKINDSDNIEITGDISASGNITASGLFTDGPISASGNFVANQITASGDMQLGGILRDITLPNSYFLDPSSNSRFNNLTLAGTFTNGFNAVMGLITASGNISSSRTGSFAFVTASYDISADNQVAAGVYFRGRSGLRFRNSNNTWNAMEMLTNGKLQLASGGNNDRGHLKLHADHGASPRTSVIEFQNEVQSGSFLFTDASQSLKFHTSDPGEDDSVGYIVGVPKVEMLSVTSSTLNVNTPMTLPNSLTYKTSTDGYEYLEIFADGIRLNRTIDYAEVDTSTVRYLISIPSQSIITYKSLRTV